MNIQKTINYFKELTGEFPTKDNITSLYRRLSLKFHPDTGGSNAKFRELAEHYQLFLDHTESSGSAGVTEERIVFSQNITVIHHCRIDDICNEDKLMRFSDILPDGPVSLPYPGFYTAEEQYEVKGSLITVKFLVNCNGSEFKYIPDLDGLSVTIFSDGYIHKRDKEYYVRGPKKSFWAEALFVDHENENVLFTTGGFKFRHPFTGQIMESVLIIQNKSIKKKK